MIKQLLISTLCVISSYAWSTEKCDKNLMIMGEDGKPNCMLVASSSIPDEKPGESLPNNTDLAFIGACADAKGNLEKANCLLQNTLIAGSFTKGCAGGTLNSAGTEFTEFVKFAVNPLEWFGVIGAFGQLVTSGYAREIMGETIYEQFVETGNTLKTAEQEFSAQPYNSPTVHKKAEHLGYHMCKMVTYIATYFIPGTVAVKGTTKVKLISTFLRDAKSATWQNQLRKKADEKRRLRGEKASEKSNSTGKEKESNLDNKIAGSEDAAWERFQERERQRKLDKKTEEERRKERERSNPRPMGLK